MLAASFGLQNTSHNVANMQSPGFKRKDVFYSSLGDNQNKDHPGAGVTVGGTSTNFNAGSYLKTGNPCDLAILGQGFFIIRLKNGELVYTRDGGFTFNKEGFLIDKHNQGLVQGFDEKGNLVPIQQLGPPNHIGKATSNIDLKGEFLLVKKTQKINDKDPFESDYENFKFTVDTLFDTKGKKHSLELEFKPQASNPTPQLNQDGLEWNLDRVSYDGVALNFKNQSLKFNSQENGWTEEKFNSIQLNLPANQLLTLNCGNYWTEIEKSIRLNKSDATHSNSQITIYKQDGYEEGKQIGFSFDENGQISYSYDNQQSLDGVYLALAKFPDQENNLIQTKDNLFRCKNEHSRQLGRANKEGFGSLQPQELESSNVDSTTEFANIVVLQRMFQACSQIMDIDKQLLEELYKK